MFRRILNTLSSFKRTFGIRFDRGPIGTVDDLAFFVQTRSSYIAQTALYGYLKTRMGTRFRAMFEDDVFSAAIRSAAVKLFVSCLGDLTIFTAGHAASAIGMTPGDAEALARKCFRRGLEGGLKDLNPEDILEDALAIFDRRVTTTDWSAVAEGEAAFAGSAADLVRFAPVIDEFKDLDREIVTNSIRFRWHDVRTQARKRIDPAAIGLDWAARSPDAATA